MKGFEIGLLERIYFDFIYSINRYGVVSYQSVVDFILKLRKYQFDAHVMITAQNGVGKSMLALSLAKLIDPKVFEKRNIIYAFNSTAEFIDKLVNNQDSVVVCDEINSFFNYKQSMTGRQVSLFNTIEIARAKRNALISCCRDARRVNNNYRNGKVQIVIWIIDRYGTMEGLRKDDYVGYAMVFVANPILEHEDKFGFDLYFQYVNTIEDMRAIGENLDTFVGYMMIEHVKKYLTDEEIRLYEQNKIEQMSAQMRRNQTMAIQSDMAQQQLVFDEG